MGNIGDSFSTAIPTVGASGPQYATDMNLVMQEVVSRLSNKVPLSSVSFNSDLNMQGSNILNATYMTLQNVGSTPAASPINRLTAFGGDLWYVSPSGPIQMTTGAALNSAAIGGITGDYGGANPAQFRYVAVDSRYNAYANFSTNTLGDIRALGFQVAAGATSAVKARILFGGSVDKTYTLPPAAATSAIRPLYMDSSGAISVGYNTKQLQYSGLGAVFAFAPVPTVFDTSGGASRNTQGVLDKGLDMFEVGQRIISVTFSVNKVDTSSTTYTLRKTLAGTVTTLGTVSSTTAGAQTLSFTLGTPETVASSTQYYLQVSVQANDAWFGGTITVDLPV